MAFSVASQLGLNEVVGALDEKDKDGSTPLDCALRAGSIGIAKQLIEAGCQPTKLYIIEDCGPKLAEVHSLVNTQHQLDSFLFEFRIVLLKLGKPLINVGVFEARGAYASR